MKIKYKLQNNKQVNLKKYEIKQFHTSNVYQTITK